jgi:hypothetical protein
MDVKEIGCDFRIQLGNEQDLVNKVPKFPLSRNGNISVQLRDSLQDNFLFHGQSHTEKFHSHET